MPNDSSSSPRDFATTHWSIVVAAGNDESEMARVALAQLCESYWYPLYAYVRRRGHQSYDAQDLTQAFFTRLLDKDVVRHADRDRGRFRSFLLKSLDHFLANEWRKQTAEKRGGGRMPLSLDFDTAEQRLKREPVDDMTPQRMYERQWALTVLEAAMLSLRDEYTKKDKRDLFESLSPMISGDKQPYRDVAESLGMTEGAVKVAVHRLRKSYRQSLRDQIAQTVETHEHIDEELDSLFDAVRSS